MDQNNKNNNKPFKGQFSEKEFISVIKGCKIVNVDHFITDSNVFVDDKNNVRIITTRAKCYMEIIKTKKEKLINEVIPPPKDKDSSIEVILGKILDKMEVIELDLKTLKEDVAQLKTDMVEVKSDVAQLKTDMVEVKSDVALLKQDVAILKADMIDVKSGKYCKNHNLYENA
ncbi:hypothetical protein D8X55_04990 [Malacoplasma penetrans]|uniref:DUF16 domain-containing protein n=1 Tax=Malacoplasma penetrans (strain HF-2) TaxID=272633 RepID=Q8EVJ6_MALP2|nr:hypothetical protein [Malacoplasma penetrans]RXY95986.1 hypothetical protein D8X55_04990 [Malacoplasma penetrans]BAC44358.1 hypothetical protein [Malacoplasma penetrans HF-2]